MRLALVVISLVILTGCSAAYKTGGHQAIYQVQKGETISRIADQFDLSIDELASANKIEGADRVRAGTLLVIPASVETEAAQGAADSSASRGSLGRTRFLELGDARQYIGRLYWPIRGALVSSGFGHRSSNFHEGVDLSAPSGTPIYAAHGGEVVFAGEGLRGYGKMVVIKGRGMATIYSHNSRNFVRSGDEVAAGDEIAAVGQTGDATGPHLHFEVRVIDTKGRYVAVDPMAFYLKAKNPSRLEIADRGSSKKPL